MKYNNKVLVLLALTLSIGTVLVLKRAEPPSERSVSVSQKSIKSPRALPQLIDLGANKCIPCKAMVPILDELKQSHSDQFQVTFIDVWKDKDSGQRYKVRIIPTQIFFSADGEELFRHEGFLSREEILDTWKQLGVTLQEPTLE